MEKAKENTSGWKGQRAKSCEAGKQRKNMSEMSEVCPLAELPVFEAAGPTDLSQKGNFENVG